MDDEGGLYNPGSDKQAESAENLRNTEQSFYNPHSRERSLNRSGLYRAEKSSSVTSKGLKVLTGTTPMGRALRFIAKHKKGAAIGGGGTTGLIIGIILVFGFIAAHELQTIEQDMLKYEDKAVSYVIKKTANKLLQKMACRTSAAPISGCSSADSGEPSSDTPNEDPMTSEIDKFNFEDPNVQSALENQGIKVNTDSEGKFTGLTDLETNQPITASDFNNSAMIDRFQAAIPEWDVGQESTFRSLMTEDESANFNVFTSPDEETDKVVEDTMAGDLTEQQLVEASAENNDQQPSQNAPADQQAAYTAEQTAVTDNNSILKQVNNDILAGDTETQVLESVGSSIPINGLLPTAVTDACTIDQAATGASKGRIPKLIGFLVRHSTTLISVADEMKIGGKISGTQISKFSGLLNGNPSVSSSSSDPVAKLSSLPFDRSAAWQRISGNTPNLDPSSSSYTPDMSQSTLPIPNAGTNVVNGVNGVINRFGGAIVCKGATNSFISTLLGAGQLLLGSITGPPTLGASDAVIFGGVISFQEALKHVILPKILKYFTPIAVDGLENSVEWMNNADAGSNIAMNMFAQRLGGKPISNSTSVALNAAGAKLQTIAQQQQSFVSRTFSFSNPSSLFSRLLVHLPLSQVGIINTLFRSIISSPLALIRAVGALIGGDRVYAASQASDPGAPYHITQYGFDTSEINKYDPITNESYLFSNSATYVDSKGVSHTNTLINLLGNPNNYPNATIDYSPVDILHCFAPTNGPNGELQAAENLTPSSAPNEYCGTVGNLYDGVTPVQIGSQQIASSFCMQLDPAEFARCMKTMPAEVSGFPDLITRFRQYILDDEITGYYTSLMSIN